MESPPLFPLYLVFFLNIDLISLLLHNFQSKNEEFLGIWIRIRIWIAAAAGGDCHGDDVSEAAGCQVCDDVIMISTGVADPIPFFLISFGFSPLVP